MAGKPRTAAGYDRDFVEVVRGLCLYVATKLGDLLDDVVIVGGLVPSLLVDQGGMSDLHVGTADLDLGLSLAIFDHRRYEALTGRLRGAGFHPDRNEKGNPTRQRWVIEGPRRATVDFLIPPTTRDDVGGRVKNIEDDFAAIIAPGLKLAFHDRARVAVDGRTIRGERARREVWVCGAAAFVVMKALAFRLRGENKDAYDLVYVIRNAESSGALAARLLPLIDEPEAREAVRILREDFAAIDSLGPRRVAEFLSGEADEAAQADAWSAVQDVLDRLPA